MSDLVDVTVVAALLYLLLLALRQTRTTFVIVGVVLVTAVQVVVSGPRRRFSWVHATDLRGNLGLVNRAPGANDIFLTATNVELPEGMTFVNIVPRIVRVTLAE
jgi:hypothetical protein